MLLQKNGSGLKARSSSSFGQQQSVAQHARPAVSCNLFKNVKREGGKDKVGGGKDFAQPAPSAKPKKESSKAQDVDGKGLSGIVQALDFSQARSKGDAQILYDTKTQWKKGETKMSREQYAALRRKIGGTYKDYMKEYVEEDVFEKTYTKPGSTTGTVPYLPLLVGVVGMMLAVTVIVVAKTS